MVREAAGPCVSIWGVMEWARLQQALQQAWLSARGLSDIHCRQSVIVPFVHMKLCPSLLVLGLQAGASHEENPNPAEEDSPLFRTDDFRIW